MFKNWNLGKKTATAFVLAWLAVLMAAMISYQNTYSLIEADRLVIATDDVRREIGELLSELKDAETGQRGYIITGDESYLAPYLAAIKKIKGTFDQLQHLTSGDPGQQRRLASLSALIDSKLGELKRTIDLRNTQGFDAARSVVTNNEGKDAMEKIRALAHEADQAELEMLEQRGQAAKSSAQRSLAISLWGSLTGALAVGALAFAAALISLRRKSEVTVRHSEERFRRVVEFAPNAIVMIRASGQMELVNAQAERLFGYSREELLGEPVEKLVPPRFRGRHPGLRSSFFEEPQWRPMGEGRNLYGLKKDGSEFPVEIGLNPIETQDGMMVLSSIADISERKHKDENILAALKEKEILLGEIHHRVKNNLQMINALLDLQAATLTDKAAAALLIDSQNRIKSMALIHQTLYESRDFARVDFGSFLHTLVPNLVSSYSADRLRVSFAVDAADVSLPIKAAIPSGLIVNELVSNALKHAFPDGKEGKINIALAAGKEGDVLLSVSDNGRGIPDEFDLANSATLGLQLVTLLAEQLGAALTIQRSNPTCFTFRFKVQP